VDAGVARLHGVGLGVALAGAAATGPDLAIARYGLQVNVAPAVEGLRHVNATGCGWLSGSRRQECLDLRMVPLIYVLLTAFQVPCSFGVTEAALALDC